MLEKILKVERGSRLELLEELHSLFTRRVAQNPEEEVSMNKFMKKLAKSDPEAEDDLTMH